MAHPVSGQPSWGCQACHRAVSAGEGLLHTAGMMDIPHVLPETALHSPAADRNKAPILAELRRLLAASGGHLLEIASGTGQHAAHFAPALPAWQWQPTDLEDRNLTSVKTWAGMAGDPANLLMPVRLDVTVPGDHWPVGRFDAVYCANMIHIAPWEAALGLLGGTASRVDEGGLLVLYGPYRVGDEPMSEGNAAFDADLKARDAAWGLRELGAVVDAAATAGWRLRERVNMPANNLLVVFERHGPAG